MKIALGELAHADRHGALVIPLNVLPSLNEAMERVIATGRIVLKPARAQGSSLGKQGEVWAEVEKARI